MSMPGSRPSADTFTVIVTAHEGTEGVTATDQTPITATGLPDLVVAKSDGGATVNAGGSVAYTINYSNAGLANATGVVLTEFLPAGSTFNAAGSTPGWVAVGTCEFRFAVGNLAAGASGSVVFAVTVPSPVPVGLELLSNTVYIADDGTHGADTNPANNTSFGQHADQRRTGPGHHEDRRRHVHAARRHRPLPDHLYQRRHPERQRRGDHGDAARQHDLQQHLQLRRVGGSWRRCVRAAHRRPAGRRQRHGDLRGDRE